MYDSKFEDLEKAIGYCFKNKTNLYIALTHKSYSNENLIGNKQSYERFEFLGDAILEYLVSDFLFINYKDMPEGDLTKTRASLVCEFTLSKIARDLNLGGYGFFSKGERNTGGPNRDSILCDMFESLIGAIYLDGGMEEARSFVSRFLLTDIESKKLFHDSKTKLQEYAQKKEVTLVYELIEEVGPAHDKEYRVRAVLDGKIEEDGAGHSRKAAEQMAAFKTLSKILRV